MSVSLNAVMTGGNNGDTHAVSGTTSFSTTGITVASGTDSGLIVVLNWGQGSGGTTIPSSRSVTWNGVAMTEVAFVNSGGSQISSVGIYALANPATGAQTLAGSWSGSLDCYGGAICFDGTDQSTVINASDTATGTGLTISVTGSSDGATVASHIRNGSLSGTNQTKFWDFDSFNPGGTGSYEIGGTGSITHDFNSGTNLGTLRATAAVHVIASAGGGGGEAIRIFFPMAMEGLGGGRVGGARIH